MTTINLIKKLHLNTHQETLTLINKVNPENWLDTPQTIETNINWQLGHITIANYLHGIASITGPSELVRSKINIQDYLKFYGQTSNPNEFDSIKPSYSELLENYELIFELTIEAIDSLNEDNLKEPTSIPNPSAETKEEALTKLYSHQNWHNGQIAVLNRVLFQR